MSGPEQPKTVRKRTPSLPSDRSNDASRVSETDIATRAFGYYCERGFQHGSDVEDWLRAERELAAPSKSPRRRAMR
jgi:hypothetical protein